MAGMKYRDAGNPSVIPDSIISPRGTITKTLYLSDKIRFDEDPFLPDRWLITGVILDVGETIRFTLNLKIRKGNHSPKYYTVISPPITVRLKKK